MNLFLPNRKHLSAKPSSLKLLFLSGLFFASAAYGQAGFSSAASGDWNVSTSWAMTSGTDEDGIPDANDDVTILNAHTITVDAASAARDLTINAGGTFANTMNAPVSISGNLQNDGTFTAGTGVYTFDGSGKFFRGTLSIPNVTITGGYTNDATLTVATSLAGTGTLKQGGGVNLTIGGAISIAGLNATSNPTNTVTYNGSPAQDVLNTTYGNLTLSGAGAKTLPAAALAINRNLSIKGGAVTANGDLAVGGNFDLLNGTFNAGTFTHTVTGDLSNSTGIVPGTSTFIFNAPAFQTIGSSSFYNVVFSTAGSNKVATGDIIVANDLTIASGTNFSASPSPDNYNHSIGGNWINDGTFMEGTGTITFNGAAAQSIGGAAATAFYNFTINNASGVTLKMLATVQAMLTFSTGTINSSGTNLLIFNDNAAATGESNSSFVNGPVQKVGNDIFTFPVGKAGAGYHPIRISDFSDPVGGGTFTAEYIRASARALSDNREAGLNAVSKCEYWDLDRNAPGPGLTVRVTLFWNGNSGCGGTYITDPATLVVAHYNGSQWHSHGGSADPASTGTSGSVISIDNVDDFSPFTIGTVDAVLNPLPVTFISFEGRKVAAGTQLSWKVGGETNVKGYEVERKGAGGQFTKIGFVEATGSSSYSFTDATWHNGAVFYRLKNIDQDGRSAYSAIITFENGAGAIVFNVYPTVVIGKAVVQHDAAGANTLLSISTADGRQVKLQRPAAGSIKTDVDMSNLRAGMYLLRYSDGKGHIETVKLVKQ